LKGQENLTLETISKLEIALGINLLSLSETVSEHIFTNQEDDIKEVVEFAKEEV
jgi:hypothetical protein